MLAKSNFGNLVSKFQNAQQSEKITMKINHIAVAIICKNSAATLEKCLQSLTGFEEVILYDNDSTDGTLGFAKKFKNVKIIQGPWLGFGKTKQKKTQYTDKKWIFSLDSDECISETLFKELYCLKLDDRTIYKVVRDNYYGQKHIKYSGWGDEKFVRLFNKDITNFNDAAVHEEVLVKNLKCITLKGCITHHSFSTVNDFLKKMTIYSEIYAQEHTGSKKGGIFKGLSRGLIMFIKCFLLKRGFLDGFEGFVICFFSSLGTIVKYIKLEEKNRKNGY